MVTMEPPLDITNHELLTMLHAPGSKTSLQYTTSKHWQLPHPCQSHQASEYNDNHNKHHFWQQWTYQPHWSLQRKLIKQYNGSCLTNMWLSPMLFGPYIAEADRLRNRSIRIMCCVCKFHSNWQCHKIQNSNHHQHLTHHCQWYHYFNDSLSWPNIKWRNLKCKKTSVRKQLTRPATVTKISFMMQYNFSCPKDKAVLSWWLLVVGQGQLAHCVAWLDPIDDGGMVWQSVANWTEAKVQANMRDQYCMKGSFHGRGVNRGQDRDHDCDHEHGWNQGSWHDSLSMALVKLS